MGTTLTLGSGTMYIDGRPIGEISHDREFFVSLSEDGDSVDPEISIPVPEKEITLTAKINKRRNKYGTY